MILNMKLPQHIVDAFREEFERDIDEYWNPFQGWLWGNCDAKLFDDFPELAQEQNDIIGKIINHEAQVFDKFRVWASDELDRRKYVPSKILMKDYPDDMKDDVI